jgi:hypothetical protein
MKEIQSSERGRINRVTEGRTEKREEGRRNEEKKKERIIASNKEET